jgi:hypothetical protein
MSLASEGLVRMSAEQFEGIVEREAGPGKAARLKELVGGVDTRPELYNLIHGESDDNEFTNAAVMIFCTLARKLYAAEE